MRLLCALVFLNVLLGGTETVGAQVVEIQGYVKTAGGAPIKDVYISGFGRTDESGRFKFASDVLIKYWKALIFDKKGFVPQAVRLDAAHTNFDVILEPEKDVQLWEVPNCGRTKAGRDRIVGTFLKIAVPRAWKFKTGYDTDYRYYFIGYGVGEKKSWLRGGLGNMYGSSYPSAETLLSSPNYTYRRTSLGIDWRGVNREGRYWRHLGNPSLYEIYDYETDSREAADAFDRVLDGICFQPGR
ncbi:MAG: hypothetical protein JOZ96_09955 [Acidobacteria bacterium]|nr:hypothetical protein [Acidobacteriota bacterium]